MYSALFPVTRSKLQPSTFCLHTDPKSSEAKGHFRKGTPTQNPFKKPPHSSWKNIYVFELYQNISDKMTLWYDRLPQTNFDWLLFALQTQVSFQKVKWTSQWLQTRQNKMTINPDHGCLQCIKQTNVTCVLIVTYTCCSNTQWDNNAL